MQQCGDWAWGGRSAAWPPEPRVPPPPVENFTPPVRFETVWGPCDTVCSAALFTDYTHWRRSLDRERRHVEHRKVTASGTRRPGLLSLSVLSMQAAMSTWRKPGGVNRHIAWHTSPCTWSHSVRWCLAGGWLAEISADLREAVAH